jgi:NAD+ synthase
MASLQEEIIEALHAKSSIDAEKEIRNRVNFLKEFLRKTEMRGFVLGISGGQDSALAGKLAQIAVSEMREEIGSLHTPSFWGIRLPYGVQHDETDAEIALDFIKPDEVRTYNIKRAIDGFTEEYNDSQQTREGSNPGLWLTNDRSLSDYAKGNAKARMRMIAQYAFAGEHSLAVIGTDHNAEAISGFFTKYGDGGADILPLAGLNKRQGKALLKALNAPESIYLKVPTADLLDGNAGQPDETELGVTYDEIDDYLEGKQISLESQEKIEERYLMTEHKRQLPITPADSWWK